MKKLIHLFLLCQLMGSCLMPGCPHGHGAACLNGNNTDMKVAVGCYQFHKTYIINGTQKEDSVYISFNRVKKPNQYFPIEYQGRNRVYTLRIGDHKYHKHALSDTIKVKVIKPNAEPVIYSFAMVADSRIKK